MPLDHRVLANELLDKMLKLREEVYKDGQKIYKRWKKRITRDEFRGAAKNLAYYIALRQRDIRPLQGELAYWGLSSLGRLESRTLITLNSVISTLSHITGRNVEDIEYPSDEKFFLGHYKLQENTEKIFGTINSDRNTAIMVTLDKKASNDYELIKELINAGMNVVRMNCAHDNPEIWMKIINLVRRAEKELKKSCRVAVDIAGPKARSSWLLASTAKNRATVGTHFFLSKKATACVSKDYVFQMGCSLPEILDEVKVGDRFLYDDGILEGVVIDTNEEGVLIETTKTSRADGVRFRVDKGIIFPNSEISLGVITEDDEAVLDFVVPNVDIINFSFIKNVKDVRLCMEAVDKRLMEGMKKPAIVAKIETQQGIDNLANIIAEAAGQTDFGVMIARGDLAVETGYLRLAELQQQILWICEAADVPVIWATHVLDQMVGTGIPSRAELTDASEGAARAECVMLNKGDHLVETVEFLNELLVRMESNVYKKTPRLRALNIARKVEMEEDEE